MPLVPGMALSLVPPSICRNNPNDDQTEANMKITDETILGVETLKHLLSMLSLSIQSLYGGKKGGLLSSKAGAKGSVQPNRAKVIFMLGAKEYLSLIHI